MKMRVANLRHAQTDPNYKALSDEDLEDAGFSGIHTVLFNVEKKRLAILQVKSQKGNDYSLNLTDTDAGKRMHRQGYAKAVYVAQVDPDHPDIILHWETLGNVLRNIGSVEPRDGKHGPYWYIKAKSFLVGGSSVKRETWAPGTLMGMLRNGNGQRRRPPVDFEDDEQRADY